MKMNIYRQQMLDHYKNPRNFGSIEDADATMELENLSCGDKIIIYFKLQGDKVESVMFEGEGCAVAIATASQLTGYLKGKSIKQVKKLTYEDLAKVINIELSLTRIKCANLSLETAQKALDTVD